MKNDVLGVWLLRVVFGCLILVIIGTGFLAVKMFKVSYETTSPDPERARFMLECTYDWMLSPQECRDILNGEDPVTPPPEFGC